MDGDAAEGPVVFVCRDEVLLTLNEIKEEKPLEWRCITGVDCC